MSLVEIEIEADAWLAALPQAAEVARRAAEAALSGYPDLADSDVVVLLADDTELQDLNREHRGKDAPTNVLSFPAPEWAAPHLGDIALSFETCAAEAAAQGKSLEAHLAHLTVHGILHLLGHDHQADDEAETMEALERQILKGLGYADPYAGEAA